VAINGGKVEYDVTMTAYNKKEVRWFVMVVGGRICT